MSDITLSSGIRQNLLALQNTSNDLNTTQEQLSTGKKVNSAFDNPTSYFTSQSLTNRANDLSALLDQIGQAQQTLNAANNGLTGLTSLLEQALSTAQQAQQATTGTVTYSGTQTGSAIAADTTQAVSTTTFANAVAAGSTPSVQTTSVFKAAGLAQTDRRRYADLFACRHYGDCARLAQPPIQRPIRSHDLAGLTSVLNTGTGASGNLSAVATVTNVGGAGGTVQRARRRTYAQPHDQRHQHRQRPHRDEFYGQHKCRHPGRCADDFRRRRPLSRPSTTSPITRVTANDTFTSSAQSHQRDRVRLSQR